MSIWFQGNLGGSGYHHGLDGGAYGMGAIGQAPWVDDSVYRVLDQIEQCILIYIYTHLYKLSQSLLHPLLS